MVSCLMKSFLLIMFMLSQGREPEIAYRLLMSKIPGSGDRVKEAAFAVSIERQMNRPGVEALVCRILANEQPPKFEKLNVLVFLNLDKFLPDEPNKNADRQMAWYVWDSKLPRIRGRL